MINEGNRYYDLTRGQLEVVKLHLKGESEKEIQEKVQMDIRGIRNSIRHHEYNLLLADGLKNMQPICNGKTEAEMLLESPKDFTDWRGMAEALERDREENGYYLTQQQESI
jgi:hypothetical protein